MTKSKKTKELIEKSIKTEKKYFTVSNIVAPFFSNTSKEHVKAQTQEDAIQEFIEKYSRPFKLIKTRNLFQHLSDKENEVN